MVGQLNDERILADEPVPDVARAILDNYLSVVFHDRVNRQTRTTIRVETPR
jgi:hypothetical protein